MLENHGLRPNLSPEALFRLDAGGFFRLGRDPPSRQSPPGILFPKAGLTIITESELFGEKRMRRRPAPLKDHALAAFSELQMGDFVVHADHGIGIYRGLLKLTLGDEEHDFLLLEYQGGDKLYLPVYRLNLVQKYVGGGRAAPSGPARRHLLGEGQERVKTRSGSWPKSWSSSTPPARS